MMLMMIGHNETSSKIIWLTKKIVSMIEKSHILNAILLEKSRVFNV